MIASTHLVVGAAAGLAVQRCLSLDVSNSEKLFWAFIAGFASHLILDALPHKEYSIHGLQLWLVLLIETSIAFAFTLFLQNNLLLILLIFLGMVGGALPDVIELVYFHMFNWSWLGSLGRIIHFCHSKNQVNSVLIFNFYTQVILAMLAIVFVRFIPHLSER